MPTEAERREEAPRGVTVQLGDGELLVTLEQAARPGPVGLMQAGRPQPVSQLTVHHVLVVCKFSPTNGLVLYNRNTKGFCL